MLIHAPCLGRQKQNIDSARSTNEKSMGVRNSSVLRQRQGTGGQVLVLQLTPSPGLSLGGSGQCWISWTGAKTNQTSRTPAENKIERGTFSLGLREELKQSLSLCGLNETKLVTSFGGKYNLRQQ